jgi:hypothetical protein
MRILIALTIHIYAHRPRVERDRVTGLTPTSIPRMNAVSGLMYMLECSFAITYSLRGLCVLSISHLGHTRPSSLPATRDR